MTQADKLTAEIVTLRRQKAVLLEALAFYGDPETYFAVALMCDPPCGEISEDFDETYKDMPDFATHMDGPRLGARARKAIRDHHGVKECTVEELTEMARAEWQRLLDELPEGEKETMCGWDAFLLGYMAAIL